MPSSDLQHTVSNSVAGAGDGRVACETIINPLENSEYQDLPTESFRLPNNEAETEWIENNSFYERKLSSRGNLNLGSSFSLNSSSASKRIQSKSKSPILGLLILPETELICRAFRRSCRPASSRFNPRSGKLTASPPEPTSPKVTCIGRVLSEKARGGATRSGSVKSGAARLGFWFRLRSVFKLKNRRKKQSSGNFTSRSSSSRSASAAVSSVESPDRVERRSSVDAGNLKRLSSARRPATWMAEVFAGNQAPAVDPPATPANTCDVSQVWRRRLRGPPASLRCERDLVNVGPESV